MKKKKIRHHDVIKGNIDFPENDQDIVIIKADGLPTYHFAHAVDDHLMRVTHVIRSDEWVSSIPLHLELFKTLGFKTPKYCHYAPILKEEDGKKRKISKRKDPEAAVSFYHEEGIPAPAVCEYLMNIGNSNFESWRKANPDSPMSDFKFEINKMSVSGAIFDLVKLLDVSKNVISKYTKEEMYNEVLEWAKRYDSELEELLENSDGHEIIDYKFMCFNGKVKCSFVCTNRRDSTGLKVTFFDLDWKVMPFERHYHKSKELIKKPNSYALMVNLAEKISENIPFARIDFYEVNGQPYFGEITLYPGCGFEEFNPPEWDEKLGDWLDLTNVR